MTNQQKDWKEEMKQEWQKSPLYWEITTNTNNADATFNYFMDRFSRHIEGIAEEIKKIPSTTTLDELPPFRSFKITAEDMKNAILDLLSQKYGKDNQ